MSIEQSVLRNKSEGFLDNLSKNLSSMPLEQFRRDLNEVVLGAKTDLMPKGFPPADDLLKDLTQAGSEAKNIMPMVAQQVDERFFNKIAS